MSFKRARHRVMTVHGIGGKVASNWEKVMLYTKRKQILCRKRISTLTGLKVSSLAFTDVFYRSEHVKRGLHVIQFSISWNAKMKYTNGQSSKSRWENVYFQSYGQSMAKDPWRITKTLMKRERGKILWSYCFFLYYFMSEIELFISDIK